MSEPIRFVTRNPPLSGEGGVCIEPTPSSAQPPAPSPAPPLSRGAEQLAQRFSAPVPVASAPREPALSRCGVKVLEATLACAGAAVTTASAPTGPLGITAITLAGAMCGLKAMTVAECLNESP